jgi:uncharacterized protein affecting Mg2+/Co2+ transport
MVGDKTETVDGEIVMGLFPTINAEMEIPFVYESSCPVKSLGIEISGWIEFKYLEGP